MTTRRRCAFCDKEAKISGEHLWSAWMSKIFGNPTFRLQRRDDEDNVISEWKSDEINITVNVVCKPCNEGWMSHLEESHARPAMTELILGHHVSSLDSLRASAIARFACKTAMVVDYMRPAESSFFGRAERLQFGDSLCIPNALQVFLACFRPGISGRLHAFRYSDYPDFEDILSVYVCTYGVGRLIFQVVCAKFPVGFPSFHPVSGFEDLAVPLYPDFASGLSWPLPDFIVDREHFERFSTRWSSIAVPNSWIVKHR
jgi:hypothetical protein